jgi:hypothetical protein
LAADLSKTGMPFGRWRVRNDPENQLEDFLASIPEWMRRLFQNGYGALSASELSECTFDSRVQPLKAEYETILQKMPARWKEYRKRVEREVKMHFLSSFVPKGKPGRPLDTKAQEYFEQHSGDSSYADIAKQELHEEPEGESKKLQIKKERERIRASVRRSRRR